MGTKRTKKLKKKQSTFYGLMLKYRSGEFISKKTKNTLKSATSLNFKNFKKYFTPLLSIIYVFKYTRF